MDHERLEEVMFEAIESALETEAEDLEGATPNSPLRVRVSTFSDAGVLTRNRGLVIGLGTSEWQVTIVRSRR